ncbi:bacteriohemerythrin [Pseudomonas sp. C27(2019)]|uniref:bacteriohemerythrin n=1 Tax=Pseudomonas sp. C27(2019) TaxID=2604941 RepID=UPI0012454965|nr:bacteriohemerythrin [Pseudomonas sp. C27(2019)]QEY58904.1 bacteriohemerythrin [Pseudomonas sp. C27(2019)]
MLDAATRAQFDIIPWDSGFETGIAIIDEQHRQLVILLNELAYGYVCDVNQSEVERILDALAEYACYHFETEEALWAQVPETDDWFAEHSITHNGFTNKIQAMRSKLKTDNSSVLVDDLLSFLTGWLVHHILYEDKYFSLVLLQIRKGTPLNTAKAHAHTILTEQTSALIQRVLSMYKKLASRTLTLQREAHSREMVQQALLAQEQQWSAVLGASSDNLWDWSFTSADTRNNDQLLTADRFSQSGYTVHPDDWPNLRQSFLNHLTGHSDVFIHQHRVIDSAGNERWVQTRGKIIERDSGGRPKRMVGTQTDVTERKTAELTLQRERDTRTLISEFAADFMASTAEDFDAAINRALQRSGEYIQADRSYVFLLSAEGHYIDNTHEWCAAGIEPEISSLQGITSDRQSWWWEQLSEVGYILISRISDLPAEAQNEHQVLASRNIRSICVYPLYINQELVGFIGNDAINAERHWGKDVIELMSLMSDLLGIALGHRKLHQKRAQAITQLERAEQQAHLGHWHIDYASAEATWSQEMFRIFECDPTHFIPSVESYLELTHPDDRASVHLSYKNAKATLSELQLEHRVLLKDAKIKHLEVRGRFYAKSEGHPATAEGTIQDVTEKVQHRESLQRLAFEDSLTGLPNRRSIESTLADEMDYCEHHDCQLALALLDLDNFSDVNAQHGPALGDALLKALAQRLKHLLGNSAVIARVGGDEFVVLFTRLQPSDCYFQQLNRLLAATSQPLSIDGTDIVLTASIGVTRYPQPMRVAAEQLVRQAQQALFQAKILGKGHFQKYDIGSEQDARERTDYLEQVRKALHAGEFVLYYQPQVYMKTGVVFGAEALVRWQKSNGELVPPGDFLPALFNHPLEVELGDWVIRTALAQMRAWKQQGLTLQVSVNLSSQQLFDHAFVKKLGEDLQCYPDISPSALQLEVLESCMLSDLEAVSGIMQRTRQLGVSFALDDFGTGYSSLAYLKHLPASVLKIDQSFVREMMESADDLSIISGVIGMANAFGMRVIAEGVENIEQGNLLLRLGCEQAQGYGIARPMPAAELPNWIQCWQAAPSWIGQQSVEVQNLPLLYAEVEHRYWVMELERWLRGESNDTPNLDHHKCKVGSWIDNEAHSRFGLHEKFSHMVNLHRDLHSTGQSAIAMRAKGQSEAALMMLPQIHQQCDLFLSELRALIN